MAGSHRSRRRAQRGICRVGACLLTATWAVTAAAQYERAAPGAVETLPQSVDQQAGSSSASTYARYDEPPPPPFDYWQPTWMPCQSLRTNRSLVLGHLYWGMDILGWATKGVHAPPLVTSSSLGNGGVIGTGDTVIRFGNDFQENN